MSHHQPHPAPEELAADYLPLHAMETGRQLSRPKVLLVDDDRDELLLTRKALESQNCEVVAASTVLEAFRQIATQPFDVLLTDLHMPEAGDGFAVVTAMRHSQPRALTVVASDYPDVRRAMDDIALQADEVLVKPFDVKQLSGLMDRRKSTARPFLKPAKEAVASILDRDVAILIQRWLERVGQIEELAAIPLASNQRTAYLPEMIRDITQRLRVIRAIEAIDTPSPAAVAHGQSRYRQGYTAPLIVQESRLLQVSIFETIQNNLATVDFTAVLPDIMIIADEVDSQLKQTIQSFLNMRREKGAGTSA